MNLKNISFKTYLNEVAQNKSVSQEFLSDLLKTLINNESNF